MKGGGPARQLVIMSESPHENDAKKVPVLVSRVRASLQSGSVHEDPEEAVGLTVIVTLLKISGVLSMHVVNSEKENGAMVVMSDHVFKEKVPYLDLAAHSRASLSRRFYCRWWKEIQQPSYQKNSGIDDLGG